MPSQIDERVELKTSTKVLKVRDLSVSFFAKDKEIPAIRQISFDIDKGEILGVVGESGSGKTLTALSLMRLIEPPGKIVGGSIELLGENLTDASERRMRALRGRQFAMIWQDPMASLNPVKRVGDQIVEVINIHGLITSGTRKPATRTTAEARALEAMRAANLSDPERRMREYPHQLSGGLQQRVMIAMALACEPELLIADEPTTALDVTIQRQILELLESLQTSRGMSVMLITHDLGVVAETCHRVLVMYLGQIVESATTTELFDQPSHPYTRGLLNSVPRLDTVRGSLTAIPGRVPDLRSLPSGCPFHPRCPEAMPICSDKAPSDVNIGNGHVVRCHLYE